MHDPHTQAFRIKNPFSKDEYGPYATLFTIWHKDPEIGGSDDSCGWFLRSWHLDKKMVDEAKKEFAFNYKNNYWYTPDNRGKFSEIALLMMMYRVAARVYFKRDWNKVNRFLRTHTHDIILFAENDTDSLCEDLRSLSRSIGHMAEIIIADIARKNRPWYKHPRWHIHHWEIQFNFFRSFYQRHIQKCDDCGKRGWKGGWTALYRYGNRVVVCGRCDGCHVAENI